MSETVNPRAVAGSAAITMIGGFADFGAAAEMQRTHEQLAQVAANPDLPIQMSRYSEPISGPDATQALKDQLGADQALHVVGEVMFGIGIAGLAITGLLALRNHRKNLGAKGLFRRSLGR